MKFSILSRRRYSHEDLKTTPVQWLKHVKHYNYLDPFCRISKLQVVFRLKVVVEDDSGGPIAQPGPLK